MNKIKIKNNKFTCPMLNTEISERGDIMFGTCAKCKNNKLGQFVDDYVYCGYGESTSSGSSSNDEILSLINNLQEQIDANVELDRQQQQSINNNQTTINNVSDNIGWEQYQNN